jgi:HAD superfamily hydrolase (TIGR01509 family)
MQLDIPSGDFAGYIFDLDGTLVDTMPLHFLAWDEAMRKAGIPGKLDEDLFYSLGGVPTRRVAEIFGQHYQLASLNADVVAHGKELLYLERIAQVKLIEPVAAFARKVAKTHPVAIATGGQPEIAIPALKAAGLDDIFKVVITPNDVPPGRGKPEPDMFVLAAERIGVDPKKCLAFEDAEPVIRAATAAGMTVVRVPSRGV